MPLYEYVCQECGEHFEKLVRFSASGQEIICPKCGSNKCAKGISRFGTGRATAASSPSASASCAPSG